MLRRAVALLLALVLVLARSPDAWAAAVRAVRVRAPVRIGALPGVSGLTILKTGTIRPRLTPSVLGAALPLAPVLSEAAPISVFTPVFPTHSPLPKAAPRSIGTQETLFERFRKSESISTVLNPESTVERRQAALGGIFDGGSLPLGSLAGASGGVIAKDLNGSYGFYSWLSELPEIAALTSESGARPELAKARILLAAAPVLEKGPVIAMKDGNTLSVLSLNEAGTPPAVIALDPESLTSQEASPQALFFADKLEAAVAADKAEGTFVNKAELLNKLFVIARSEPTVENAEEKPDLVGTEMPDDPVRRPWEYLSRLLRDAMRADDPFEALALLGQARGQARKWLDYQDGSKFLAGLRSQGELMAGTFIPGLLKDGQKAAGDNDSSEVERIMAAGHGFVEYAPKWEKRVNAAHKGARETLELLDRLGEIDPETGLPIEKAELSADPVDNVE